jgi:uncharacterized protein YbjT (DUF2867 family)
LKVHVTGATGFIGSALVAALGTASHEVRTDGLAGCDAVVHLANVAHAAADRADQYAPAACARPAATF